MMIWNGIVTPRISSFERSRVFHAENGRGRRGRRFASGVRKSRGNGAFDETLAKGVHEHGPFKVIGAELKVLPTILGGFAHQIGSSGVLDPRSTSAFVQREREEGQVGIVSPIVMTMRGRTVATG